MSTQQLPREIVSRLLDEYFLFDFYLPRSSGSTFDFPSVVLRRPSIKRDISKPEKQHKSNLTPYIIEFFNSIRYENTRAKSKTNFRTTRNKRNSFLLCKAKQVVYVSRVERLGVISAFEIMIAVTPEREINVIYSRAPTCMQPRCSLVHNGWAVRTRHIRSDKSRLSKLAGVRARYRARGWLALNQTLLTRFAIIKGRRRHRRARGEK